MDSPSVSADRTRVADRVGGLVNNTGWKAAAPAIGLAIAALGLAACGSEDEPERVERPPLSAATANRLASLSEEIAAHLDDGDVCTAAGRADELADAIESARIDDRIRPGVEAAATRLVDQVNCPPPPEATICGRRVMEGG